MTRPRRLHQAGLALALAALAACSGGGDPASPVQQTADDAYVRATFTLIDLNSPCRPGIACDPEFRSCDGTTAYTVPMTWTMNATLATAGSINPIEGPVTQATIAITGTDTSRDTALAIEFTYDVASGTFSLTGAPDTNPNFADVEADCDQLVTGTIATTQQFAIDLTQPHSMTVTSAPSVGGNVDFAQRDGTNLTGGIIEGTFDFIGQNRQVLGQVYIAQVHVQGCFRLHLTSTEQGMAVTPNPASPGC